MDKSLAIAIGVLIVGGCAPRSTSPYDPPRLAERNSLRAQELTQEAADLITVSPAGAEKLLREALVADIFYGPAHNNLGVIFLKRGDLYEAANEFEWARKLMPGNPDPRMNLALTLEQAGQVDEAIETYKAALEVSPNHIPTMQALARLQLRRSRADEETPDLLKEIALRGETDRWREWAKGQLARGEE